MEVRGYPLTIDSSHLESEFNIKFYRSPDDFIRIEIGDIIDHEIISNRVYEVVKRNGGNYNETISTLVCTNIRFDLKFQLLY